MRFGFSLIMRGREASPAAFVTLAQRSEALGLDAVWSSDHLILPRLTHSISPHTGRLEYPTAWTEAYWESITALSFLAAKTETLRLGFSVSVLPTHNPIELAKQLACLDQLSGGRVVLGVGVGWCAEESAALGVPFRERGARSDEALRLFETLWRDEPASFQGRFTRFEKAYFQPKPVTPGGPPLWVGGGSKAALRRAARYAEAYHPLRPPLDGLGRLQEKLAEASAAARRTKPPLALAVKCPLQFISEPPPGSYPTQGPPAAIVDALGRMAAAGVQEVVFDLLPETLSNALETMERFAAEIRPQLPR